MEYKNFKILFENNVGTNNDQHPPSPMVDTDHRGRVNMKLFTYKINQLLMVIF
jgi:hypothetical protein